MLIVFILLTFLPIVVAFVYLCGALWERHQNGIRAVRVWSWIAVVGLLLNPISQSFLFEGLDNLRGRSMAERAHAAGI
ncbi:MAG: hypothetical protein JNM91_13575, partial [Flavobacteriales bacterium]|nr:hypothetical protein [Flavobacteriales bacterium]